MDSHKIPPTPNILWSFQREKNLLILEFFSLFLMSFEQKWWKNKINIYIPVYLKIMSRVTANNFFLKGGLIYKHNYGVKILTFYIWSTAWQEVEPSHCLVHEHVSFVRFYLYPTIFFYWNLQHISEQCCVLIDKRFNPLLNNGIFNKAWYS